MKYEGTLIIILLSLYCITTPVCAEQVQAQPLLPHAFYGSIETGGLAIPQGAQVEAIGEGIMAGIPGNPIPVVDGNYGAEGALNPKLLVQGTLTPGVPVQFRIGGKPAQVYDVIAGGPWLDSYPYSPGGVTHLNMRMSASATGTLSQTGTTGSPATQSPTNPTTAPRVPDALSAAVMESNGSSRDASTAILSLEPVESGLETSSLAGNLSGINSSDNLAWVGTCSSASSPAGSSAGAQQGITPQWAAAGIIILVLAGGAVYYYSLKKNRQ